VKKEKDKRLHIFLKKDKYKDKSKLYNIQYTMAPPFIYITTRLDRYGANSVPWICALFISNKYNIPLYHNCIYDRCKISYFNNIIHSSLLQYSRTTTNDKIIEKDFNAEWLLGRWSVYWMCKILYTDSPNISFPDQLKGSNTHLMLRKKYNDKYLEYQPIYMLGESTHCMLDRYVSIYNKIKEGIIIHVRLGDVYDRVEDGNTKYEHQCYIGDKGLIQLVNKCKEYFKKPIYLLTTPFENDINRCLSILQQCNIDSPKEHILGSNDIDYDIFLMIHAETLILSRSTFCLTAALLRDKPSYSPKWIHYYDLTDNLPCDHIRTLDVLYDHIVP